VWSLRRDCQAALAVDNLSYAFGPRAVLHDVSFAIQPGDFTILLGPNGAGKTTLFALITRLYSARHGSIAVFGHDIDSEPRAALARLGVVFQQSTLDLDLTVDQNLFYHAALHGLSRAMARPRIAEELARVGLSERRHDRVRALSGGQRRRVELARALIHAPSLLLLDEPTVGLDMESRHFLLQHVRGLCQGRALGVLWATHLIDEAGPDCRAIILHQGRILADGTQSAISRQGETLKATFDRLTRAAGSPIATPPSAHAH
jgi:ABC-2 type transport system ATP-binding protein